MCLLLVKSIKRGGLMADESTLSSSTPADVDKEDEQISVLPPYTLG